MNIHICYIVVVQSRTLLMPSNVLGLIWFLELLDFFPRELESGYDSFLKTLDLSHHRHLVRRHTSNDRAQVKHQGHKTLTELIPTIGLVTLSFTYARAT
jgi:hypothetical protein